MKKCKNGATCPKADCSKKCRACEFVRENVKITPETKKKVASFVKKNANVLIAVATTFVVSAFFNKSASKRRYRKFRKIF